MTQWYVNELSKLTTVSVQTLHHYDRIGLLKPSVRLPNGYRLYSEKDLLKLQQIIALKFFGFELSQIKTLLSTDVDIIDHFAVQARFLEQKAKTLIEANQALKQIIADCSHHKTIPWESIIKSIEIYRMTQQLEKSWVGKIFTSEELKEYAHFEQELKTRFSESEQKAFDKEWEDVVAEIDMNLNKDPKSEFGIALGKRFMDWVNAYFGKNHGTLRNAIWKKGLKTGNITEGVTLSAKSFEWIDEAITAYYMRRINNIFNQIKFQSHQQIRDQWEELLTDMYGNDQTAKDELFKIILNKDEFTQATKTYLKKYLGSCKYAK